MKILNARFSTSTAKLMPERSGRCRCFWSVFLLLLLVHANGNCGTTYHLRNNSSQTITFPSAVYAGAVSTANPDSVWTLGGWCSHEFPPGSSCNKGSYVIPAGSFFRFFIPDNAFNLPMIYPASSEENFTWDMFSGVSDPSDHAPLPGSPLPNPDCGMPGWRVSEPYMNLWIEDEPLGYQPAIGPRVSFSLNWKQREDVAGTNAALFGVGKQWNFSWLSYVYLNGTNFVVSLPGGGVVSFTSTNTLDFLTNTKLTGDTNAGFTLNYSDGSRDFYGLKITNASGVYLKSFMTERWNPINQKNTLSYNSYTPGANPVIRLSSVVDGDGRTTTISYVSSHSFSTNLISQVVDPFNRTNRLEYDSSGRLTNIIDVAGLSSKPKYDFRNYITNLVTPYGTTGFEFNDVTTDIPNGRYVRVTGPGNASQLFLYTNSAPGVASSYASSMVPNTSPFSNNLDNSGLNQRNSFHWNQVQYDALSTTNLGSLTSGDFLKARMKHWLISPDYYITNSCSGSLSLERAASPDGSTAGQLTWYDYAGKTNASYTGSRSEPLFIARVLPGGTNSWYVRTDRNALGYTTNEVSTYSVGSTVYQRTNVYLFAANYIDLLSATNGFGTNNTPGILVSSNVFNSYHQVTTNFNALNEKTIFAYNSNQQLISITRPSGLITTNSYYTNGFTNWLKSAVDFSTSGGTTYYRTNSFTYTNGLVYSLTDERGLTVTNFWDNLQRLTGRLYPDGTTTSNLYYRLDNTSYPNSTGGTNILDLTATKDRMTNWTYSAYNAMRQVTYQTNALTNVTAFGYCECGALESMTNALGTAVQQVTSYVYDLQGNLIVTDYADTSSVYNFYDSLGRVTNILSGTGSVTNYYNNQGLLSSSGTVYGQTLSAQYDIRDRLTNSVDANGVTITNTYDNLSRLLTKGYPDGGVEKFGYTSNIAGVTSYTNQLGSNVVNYTYDPLGRKTREVNPGISTNEFQYSSGSDLLFLIDGKSQLVGWNYDLYGRVTNKLDDNFVTILTYQYDANSRLTNRWSYVKGNTVYRYDKMGNLTNVTYPVNTALTMQYDALNRLTNMTDAVGSTVYGYTAAGLLASEDGPWASDTVTYTYVDRMRYSMALQQPNATQWGLSYAYDSANRIQSLTSPQGAFTPSYKGSGNLVTNLALPNTSAITNSFDSVSRLTGTGLKTSGGTLLNSHKYGYNTAGQRTAVTNFYGNYLNYTYDLIGQLKTATGKESGGTTRNHEKFGYVYDAAGNLNYRTNNALIQTFTINNLNELSSATRTGTLTVAGTTSSSATSVTVNGSAATIYNDNAFAGTGFTVTNGNNTYTAIGQDSFSRKDTNTVSVNLPTTLTYTYDVNGNLTSDGARGFVYDDENQLTRVTVTNSWKSEFSYDGKFRRRIRKEFSWIGSAWVQTNEVRYVYDGDNVIQERDANNIGSALFTRTGLRLLARTDQGSGQTAYYHSDGNGNITAMVNAQQAVIARYSYDPYGNILSKSGPLADANLYRFSSKELHSGSGLIYFGRRFYDPNLQRWLNRDPIAEQGGINLYGYVGNDPISMIDPFGLFGNPVSGPDGPVGPSTPYAPGGVFYVPTPLPPPGPEAYIVGGLVVGAVTTAAVVVAAPVAVSALVVAGVSTSTATAAVTTTIGVAGAIGGGLTLYDAGQNAVAGNWNGVAYDVSLLAGGALVGGFGGGRFLADNVSPQPSTVPRSWNPFTADTGYGFVRNPNLPLRTDLFNWLGTGPTPSSGGLSATGIGSDTGLLFRPWKELGDCP